MPESKVSNSSTPDEFAGLLKRLRKEIGLSQAEVAEALSVSQASISAWEMGRKHPADTSTIISKLNRLKRTSGVGANVRSVGSSQGETEEGVLAFSAERARRMIPALKKERTAQFPESGVVVFEQVREYADAIAEQRKSLAQLSGLDDKKEVPADLDVWVLGPAHLPIMQVTEPQSKESHRLWIDLIENHRAEYYVVWDLERIIRSPAGNGDNIGGQQALDEISFDMRALVHVIDEIDSDLDRSRADSENDGSKTIKRFKHVPFISSKISKRSMRHINKIWNIIKKTAHLQNWQDQEFLDIVEFNIEGADESPPENTQISNEAQPQDDKLKNAIDYILNSWSKDSSIFIYIPRNTQDFALAPPMPIANIRQEGLATTWNHLDERFREYKPIAWLIPERARELAKQCEIVMANMDRFGSKNAQGE